MRALALVCLIHLTLAFPAFFCACCRLIRTAHIGPASGLEVAIVPEKRMLDPLNGG